MTDNRTLEQKLVEEMGAEISGKLQKLGEFPVRDGEEDGSDLLEAAKAWLQGRQFLSSRRNISYSTTSVSGAEELAIRIYKGKESYTEFRFRALPEPHPKRYHLIGVWVLVPPDGDAT